MRFLLLICTVLASVAAQTVTHSLQPPGRGYEIAIGLGEDGNGGESRESRAISGFPIITAHSSQGNLLLEVSPALAFADTPDSATYRSGEIHRSNIDETWTPVYGERNRYPNRYSLLTISLEPKDASGFTTELELRAYDEGFAWRIHFTLRGKVRVESEDTRFRLPAGTSAWATYRAQATYERVPISGVKEGCERPLMLELPDGTFAALAEAGMDNFARMKFGPAGENTLRAMLDSPVEIESPYTTPWRAMILGKTPGEVLERNYLLLNLNAPSKIEDTSWIKPGKVMREVTLSTKGGRELVDFAVTHKLDFIEYDAGWYGHEYDDAQDARTVTPDPDRTNKIAGWSGLDLQEVIRYAKSRDIGVILYVNRRHLEKQIDQLLPLYKRWGVSGLKYGFVNVGSQQWSKWLHDAVRKAAAHQLMVDIHDEYRPTGLSRTWPNLMTQEGILGNEAMPDATHNMVLPFTRGVAGAGDYTICYYTPRIKTTHPHQLALAVIMYSPWQFLFWYDRPSDYQGEPEIRYFEELPTVWDDTRVVRGEIGKYISMARRKGDAWWLATATNTEARTVEVPLEFLDSGKRYVVDLYEEPSAPAAVETQSPRTKVAIRRCFVEGRKLWKLQLPPSGGHAAVFRPEEAAQPSLPTCKGLQ